MNGTVGFFGKLPSHGDFVHRRIAQPLLDTWDEWLQRCIAESKTRLGDRWLDFYLTSPVWKFSMSANICGPEPYQGLIMPSVDRVGRYYPLCIIATSAGDASPFDVAARGRDWFQQASSLLLTCLDEQPPGFDEFDRAVEYLAADLQPIPSSGVTELPRVQTDSASWSLVDSPGSAAGLTLLRLADKAISDHIGPCSLWWSEGSEEQPTAALLSRNLPDPAWYADMLEKVGSPGAPREEIPESWLQEDPTDVTSEDKQVSLDWQDRLPPDPALSRISDSAGPEPGVITSIPGTASHEGFANIGASAGDSNMGDMSLEELINTPIRLSYASAASTDAGKAHQENEDSFLNDPESGLWLVADGMGGHSAGKTASEAVVAALKDVGLPDDIDGRVESISRALQTANADMRQLSASHADYAGLGSTVTALVVAGSSSAIIWAGDTRVYRKRGAELEQLTTDHSERQEMVERGDVLSILGPTNVITRAVGGDDTLRLSVIRQVVQTGDRFLICTDGVYEEVPPGELAELLNDPDCRTASATIIERVLDGRAKDNATAVVVDALADSGGRGHA